MAATIVRYLKPQFNDPAGKRVEISAKEMLGIETGEIRTAAIYKITAGLEPEQLIMLAEEGLKDAVIHEVSVVGLPDLPDFKSGILIAKRPGVTDDEGFSLQRMMSYITDRPFSGKQEIFSQTYYFIKNELDQPILEKIARTVLANPLINHIEIGDKAKKLSYIPEVHIEVDLTVETIDMNVDEKQLTGISKTRLLSLNHEEMLAIKDFFAAESTQNLRIQAGLPTNPTDADLEILAQTWSEHCKHKEFAALINFHDLESGQKKQIDSLFKTYIRNSTEKILEQQKKIGQSWLVKIFNDNAGVVRIDENRLFVWKVETHNSPSALDPYGGALTGIVGVNRDPMGTGRGGARLLFNTDVLCFAPPDYDGELFPGQLTPLQIMNGVRHGIEDGGNKSGIPTINGAVVFDERFRAKPLVFCGTGAILPNTWNGRPAWEKEIAEGDLIVTVGGRVGKDGIHGATFSSAEIDEHSPVTAVQIGSPITQKFLADFLEEALRQNLVKCCTDNGAGGLSSSIGELATISNGAYVDLAKVPLKYSGLKPWEIFVSESQERMTLVVEPAKMDALKRLAEFFETEAAEIGHFTSNGILKINYDRQPVSLLPLNFLHDGVPRKTLIAEYASAKPEPIEIPAANIDCGEILPRILRRWNVCSRETIIRQYDHEVKGRTVVKPLMGRRGTSPQDAAVIRIDFTDFTGIAVSNGICPRYGDHDAYQMSAGAFDEAVRSIIAVGGRLPDTEKPDSTFWSVNDNFCVPDSVFDAQTNPDGAFKLGKLVKMCEALYDMSVQFGIPMTSGKDSMKNDARYGNRKVSVPPTILYSMAARIDDVRNVTTAEFKRPGHKILLLGRTYDELGCSEFADELSLVGGQVPKVRPEEAISLYRRVSKLQSEGLIASCHDCSDGGLAVALAEACFGNNLGAEIKLENIQLNIYSYLFSESHSRFLVSVECSDLEKVMKEMNEDATLLGEVKEKAQLTISLNSETVADLAVEKLFAAWNRNFEKGARA
ncbi:MAG: AIR synthase-related protein [Candidatus Riflebacteria bacterium]